MRLETGYFNMPSSLEKIIAPNKVKKNIHLYGRLLINQQQMI